jgi:hypothetical protein
MGGTLPVDPNVVLLDNGNINMLVTIDPDQTGSQKPCSYSALSTDGGFTFTLGNTPVYSLSGIDVLDPENFRFDSGNWKLWAGGIPGKNMYGLSTNETTNDRPFNRLLKNITHHTPAVYDTSWQFQPTWLRHLCEVIDTCIAQSLFNHIIPITVPQLCTRYSLAKDILSDFSVTVLAEDKKDTTPLFVDTQDTLHALGLPVYSYQQMIDGIQEEISNFLRQ